jgi:GH25 family lysozyme M1 (1,4-beta-N-acetylmuramidase)
VTIEGVDYASVDGNKPPDFAKARAAGLSFAIIRGAYTYEHSALADANLTRDRDAAQRAGLRVGTYLIVGYDPSGPSPEEQAQALIKAYGARRENEMPVALDAETNSLDHGKATGDARRAWLERAYDALRAYYGVVTTYTSANQWAENFGDADSRLGDGPLWVKVPYPWKAGQKPHPESCPAVGELPRPWRRPESPGAWIEQYQGDAKGSSGFSDTVDLNRFLPYVDDGRADARSQWVRARLAAANVAHVSELQHARSRVADSIVGPTTFCDLAR